MKLFLSISALTPSQYRQYVKDWDKTRYADLFKKFTDRRNAFRIYLPLEEKASKILENPDAEESAVQGRIKNILKEGGYELEDYKAGLCVKVGDAKRRTVRLGPIVKKLSLAKGVTEASVEQLLQNFANDPIRTGVKLKNLQVVISRHPYDIAGMSTGRGWTSCMDMDDGDNVHYVIRDVKAGTLVAYLIDMNDENINKPKARLLIKPFTNRDDPTDTMLFTESSIYGSVSEELGEKFTHTVDLWLKKVNGQSTQFKTYIIKPELYSDGSGRRYTAPEGDAAGFVHSLSFINTEKRAPTEEQLLEKFGSVREYLKTITDESTIKIWEQTLIDRHIHSRHTRPPIPFELIPLLKKCGVAPSFYRSHFGNHAPFCANERFGLSELMTHIEGNVKALLESGFISSLEDWAMTEDGRYLLQCSDSTVNKLLSAVDVSFLERAISAGYEDYFTYTAKLQTKDTSPASYQLKELVNKAGSPAWDKLIAKIKSSASPSRYLFAYWTSDEAEATPARMASGNQRKRIIKHVLNDATWLKYGLDSEFMYLASKEECVPAATLMRDVNVKLEVDYGATILALDAAGLLSIHGNDLSQKLVKLALSDPKYVDFMWEQFQLNKDICSTINQVIRRVPQDILEKNILNILNAKHAEDILTYADKNEWQSFVRHIVRRAVHSGTLPKFEAPILKHYLAAVIRIDIVRESHPPTRKNILKVIGQIKNVYGNTLASKEDIKVDVANLDRELREVQSRIQRMEENKALLLSLVGS